VIIQKFVYHAGDDVQVLSVRDGLSLVAVGIHEAILQSIHTLTETHMLSLSTRVLHDSCCSVVSLLH